MKRFCQFCNNESWVDCGICGKPTCSRHMPIRGFKHPEFEDFWELREFIADFLGGPSKDLRGDTYRYFYEKVLTKAGPLRGFKAPYCQNCAPIILDYFNKTLLPVIQEARKNGDICSIHNWCLFDAVTQCHHCRRYSCHNHSRACAVCGQAYCSHTWKKRERELEIGFDELPEKDSCASRHNHWFSSVSKYRQWRWLYDK